MILLRKIVSLNNIYINESHWLYTWQIYTVSKSRVEISHRVMEIFLILKRLEWQFDPSCGFFENASAKEIVNSWFFCDFYHKPHHSWKFHWNSTSRSEDMETFFDNISYFHQFLSIFWIFRHFLITKKLMTSGYNRWCQHFFHFQYTLNIFFNNCKGGREDGRRGSIWENF